MARCRVLWTLSLLIASLMLPPGQLRAAEDEAPVTQPAQTQPTGFDSPEAAFEAAKARFNDRDWAGYLKTVAPDSRAQLVGGLALAVGMRAQTGDGAEQARELVERYLPEDFDPMEEVIGAEDSAAAAAKIGRSIREGERFFVEAMNLAFKEVADDEASIEALENLQLDEEGRTATATVHRGASEGGVTENWRFVKLRGRWYVGI